MVILAKIKEELNMDYRKILVTDGMSNDLLL